MEQTFINRAPFQYLKCQSCSAKVNCSECERSLKCSLESQSGIKDVFIKMDTKTLRITYTPPLTENDILDSLEDEGLFTD